MNMETTLNPLSREESDGRSKDSVAPACCLQSIKNEIKSLLPKVGLEIHWFHCPGEVKRGNRLFMLSGFE
jgi:hypothetical protein